MTTASLADVAKKMKDLDFCMMVTQDESKGLQARPMSNNGKVEYDGDSWFFTYEDSNKVKQIEAQPAVSLVFQTDKMLYLECAGEATVVRDKAVLADKWVDELEQWFPQGLDTPGICLVKVEASRVQYWDGEENGEYRS